jgi:hypothetical protein
MRDLGWWSGDMHVHRPVEDSPSLSLAEDLNVNVVFTMWNCAACGTPDRFRLIQSSARHRSTW